MNTLQLLDIRNAASDMQVTLYHLRMMLALVADDAPLPLKHQMIVCASAVELMSDKALMISEIAA